MISKTMKKTECLRQLRLAVLVTAIGIMLWIWALPVWAESPASGQLAEGHEAAAEGSLSDSQEAEAGEGTSGSQEAAAGEDSSGSQEAAAGEDSSGSQETAEGESSSGSQEAAVGEGSSGSQETAAGEGSSRSQEALADEQPAITQESAGSAAVEYDNLRILLLAGSLELSNANKSYNTNKANYQSMLQTLRDEQDYMKLMADHYEDDPEVEAQYRASASILGSTASQISRRLESLNRTSSTLSVEKNIDSYTMTAQTRMNSYNQMVLNVNAARKNVEAATSRYNATVRRQAAGAATAEDVMSALDQLEQTQNLLRSYEQQMSALRFSLLSMLGLEDTASVTIGGIPEPDLAAIDAIDFETDKQKAIGSNKNVQNVRHANAGTTAEIQQKFKTVAEAEGSAEAEITAAYEQLMSRKFQYQAALEAYGSKLLEYQSLQRKKQAGMVGEADYLQGEADYLEALAAKETASMTLYQTYESYLWEVKGVV